METMAKRNSILPVDIVLFQILPRLPARYIGRLMCVCKQWHSFLTTPEFTKMHLDHVNSENRQKLLVISTAKPCQYFCTIDCEAPEDGLTAIRSLPFETNNDTISIVSSLNGLVCVGINRSLVSAAVYDYSDIVLWNPLMGEYKMLPKGDCSRITASGHGLYYSCCDDDYRLLSVTESSDAYIYSWKSDLLWKVKSRIDSFPKFWSLSNSSNFLNEKLYFLARGTQDLSRESAYSIIRFDTKTEMFTKTETPFSQCFNLTIIRGFLNLCVIPKENPAIELLKMDEDGKWTKVVRVCMLACASQPWHLMKNGNWLMHHMHNAYIYKLDPEMRKEAIEVCQLTMDDEMDFLRRGKFVETIVSVKRLSHGLSPNEAKASAPKNSDNDNPAPQAPEHTDMAVAFNLLDAALDLSPGLKSNRSLVFNFLHLQHFERMLLLGEVTFFSHLSENLGP